MLKLMKRILVASGEYKGRIEIAFVFSFLKAMMSKAPIILSTITIAAFLTGNINEKICLQVGIAMIILVVLQIIFQHTADRLQSAAGFLMFAKKRMALGVHLRKMPMGYFTEGNIGKISSVLSSDMVFIEENCMTEIANMMNYAFSTAIFVAFMCFFNIWIGLLTGIIVLIIVLKGKTQTKEAIEESHNRQAQNESLTEAVLDFTEGIGIIKTYNLLGEKSKQLTDNFKKTREVSLAFEQSHVPFVMNLYFLCGMGSAITLAMATYFCYKGLMPTMNYIAMTLFVFEMFAPIKALYTQIPRLTVMNSCMDRIEKVFNEKELPNTGVEHFEANNEAEISFENVSFAYDTKEVLHDINFTLEKNKMLALVGPSGGGKSTVANLLARLWDVKAGSIKIRGKDIRKVPLAELMDNISMVFQRVYLFQDTIYNNISMGKADATEEEVYAAAKKARCYDFIMSLPDGFNTMIGEGGASLSGGEKQRISIARGILKDAPIIILDEATASVDADNERYIQEAINELCKGKTLLVIAHRLNTISHADKILVINNGTIAQEGTHDELLAQEGMYRSFVSKYENMLGWNTTR